MPERTKSVSDSKFLDLIMRIWESNALKVALLLVVTLLFLMNIYGLGFEGESVDYERFGTVGEWFANIATLIAIAIAGLTIVADKRNAERDRVELEESRKREREFRSQSVYAWIVYEKDMISGRPERADLVLVNKTDEPVFDWNVRLEGGSIIADSNGGGPLFPDVIQKMEVGLSPQDVAPRLTIEFMGFAGKRWSRTEGEVRLLSSERAENGSGP